MSATESWVLKARWLFPIEGPPLQHGTITIAGKRILSINAEGNRTADMDLGNCAILPALVNAHTHLDLSGLRGRVSPGEDFTAWLRAVIQHRRALTPAQVDADIRAGLAESIACGTTLLGDISGQGLSWPVLSEAPLRAVVFYELLGLPRVRAKQAWKMAYAWLESHPSSERTRPGLSPHAPYSVRASLFRATSSLARQQRLPLATHLAESQAEMELLQNKSGPFVDFLSELGVWDPGGLVQSAGQVLDLNEGVSPVLFIHGNYLDPASRIPPEGSIVCCPRTHAAFGHAPHPFRRLLARGVRIALGTDSLASNPDLDMLAEVRFLHRQYPDVPGRRLLHMATLAGAEALGWQEETGSLVPGKSADLLVLPLPDEEPPDPHDLVVESSLRAQAVLCQGRWVHENAKTAGSGPPTLADCGP